MAADPAVLARLRERIRPVTTAAERSLPVLEPLQPLLPAGLPRGAVVGVSGPGATSLALALLAGPSAAGSWVATVGLPELGWAAAAELGVDLSRLVEVPDPAPARWAETAAALVDGVDAVLLGVRHRLGATEARRLHARARERGTVLLAVPRGPTGRGSSSIWPEAPAVALSVRANRWEGLGEGWGRLEARRVTVETEGRGRSGGRPRRVELWLPGPEGVSRCSELLHGPW